MTSVTPPLICPIGALDMHEEARTCLAQSQGSSSSSSSTKKPTVEWRTTKQGWGRDDEYTDDSN